MKVTELTPQPNGWVRFNLSVGGFVVKGCRGLPASGGVLFPQRHDMHGGVHRVVYAHGRLVKRLRALLASGQTKLPRDRRPCVFTIHPRGYSRFERHPWIIFDFTVRSFTILGCRWLPERGSIQLPVTFIFDKKLIGKCRSPHRRKAVVCANGAHIVRLREALEARFHPHDAEPAEAEPVLAE